MGILLKPGRQNLNLNCLSWTHGIFRIDKSEEKIKFD